MHGIPIFGTQLTDIKGALRTVQRLSIRKKGSRGHLRPRKPFQPSPAQRGRVSGRERETEKPIKNSWLPQDSFSLKNSSFYEAALKDVLEQRTKERSHLTEK